jgi:hypothetical protein
VKGAELSGTFSAAASIFAVRNNVPAAAAAEAARCRIAVERLSHERIADAARETASGRRSITRFQYGCGIKVALLQRA